MDRTMDRMKYWSHRARDRPIRATWIDRSQAFIHEIDRSEPCGSTDLRRYGLHTHKRAFHSFLPTPLNNSEKNSDLGDSEKTRGDQGGDLQVLERRFECFVLVLVWFVKICKGVHLKTIWRRSSEPLLCFNTILSCFLHQNRFVLA